MNFEYDKFKEPQIYYRNNKPCYLDPIRKKLIYVTPEETVRQKVIRYLLDEIKVPEDMIMVEEHLSHFGINSNRRADIIINRYDEEQKLTTALAILECKAPGVLLGELAGSQVTDYCNILGADYAVLVNGYDFLCYKFDEKTNIYAPIETLPKYKEMLHDNYVIKEQEECPKRIPFEEIQQCLEEEAAEYEDDFYGWFISSMTPMSLAVPAFNLLECFMDQDVKMPKGEYGYFELIEDYGIRRLEYGNASGGKFGGPYRSFLIDVEGNTEFVSFSLSTYATYAKPDDVKTCLLVAIDNETESHHALQLVFDDNIKVENDMIHFYHHGRIAVGNIGSGKISELKELVERRCPYLIKNDKFYLGSIKNDRLWRLDDEEVINVIKNLITYALIRDEYRCLMKKRNKHKE